MLLDRSAPLQEGGRWGRFPLGHEHHVTLTWTELTQIRDVIEDILNRYSVAYDGDRLVFEPLNQFDIEHVMDALRLYVNQ